ncbi:glycosyltransferase family 39 protein [Desertivirga arenae]|uniref:glycosyltransferase family 39 protein n=1 Tax=Desertivirga arenae TaxID=2810309 RepID=UPI001A958F21|nr:glycosyltransferase family 39 protein [Pedobacter sp. SYSU D00823]
MGNIKEQSSNPSLQYVIVGIIVIMFAGYLLLIVNRQGFWHDEIYTLSFIKGFDIYLFDGSDLNVFDHHNVLWYKDWLKKDMYWINLHRNLIHEGHPPVYYILLKLWSYVFGAEETGLRSFSIFTSSLSLIVAYRIGKLINSRYSIIFPILLSSCPLFVYYGTEARSYSLYILLSELCFYYFLKIVLNRNDSKVENRKCIVALIFFSTLLFYTHYYGVFFYGVLSTALFVVLMKEKSFKEIGFLIIPCIAFLPWLGFIKAQTAVHHDHWTNGFLGFENSINHFFSGIVTLLLGEFSAADQYYLLIALIILLLIFINYVANRPINVTHIAFPFLLIAIFGISIIVFDKLLNHHTIAVPRYYIPLQFVLIFLLFYMITKGRFGLISILTTGSLLVIFFKIQLDYYKGIKEPKQMYREAAAYISRTYDPNNVDLIISPSGPSAVGIAYYLTENFAIHSLPAPEICQVYGQRRKVIVEQRLGLAAEPWMLKCKSDTIKNRTVRFVGLDIVNEN